SLGSRNIPLNSGVFEEAIARKIRQLPLSAAERRNRIYSDRPLGVKTFERDPLPVGRPCWISIGSGIVGEPQCVRLPQQLHINIEVVALFAIPTESYLVAIRREARFALDTG